MSRTDRQFANEESDLLIAAPSLSCAPVASALLERSEPASSVVFKHMSPCRVDVATSAAGSHAADMITGWRDIRFLH